MALCKADLPVRFSHQTSVTSAAIRRGTRACQWPRYVGVSRLLSFSPTLLRAPGPYTHFFASRICRRVRPWVTQHAGSARAPPPDRPSGGSPHGTRDMISASSRSRIRHPGLGMPLPASISFLPPILFSVTDHDASRREARGMGAGVSVATLLVAVSVSTLGGLYRSMSGSRVGEAGVIARRVVGRLPACLVR
jgi:hypothetical protein